MIQRFVIEDFLRGLEEAMAAQGFFFDGEEDLFEIAARDGAVIQFVQDWLKEHKGEL